MEQTETIIIGGGLAGIVAALELLDRDQNVILFERGPPESLGGLAAQAFGGMMLVDTPLQRRQRIRDSAELALADWHSFAEFTEDDIWPKRWADYYIDRCVPDVFEWLQRFGVGFFPAIQWAERGWYRPGNSVPRYHVTWGTGQRLAHNLLQALQSHPRRGRLTLRCEHTVRDFTVRNGAVTGCAGEAGPRNEHFEAQAGQIVVAAGGITGNLEKVRRHWPASWGPPPETLLNGSHPEADGALHDAVGGLGGRVTHLDKMWNYAAGVHHPRPKFPHHGLSLIPCKSALWFDPQGRRIGPDPLIAGFDTRHLVESVSRWPYTWQVLNWRIAARELAVSGAEHNPELRDRKLFAFVWNMLTARGGLATQMLAECPDFVAARTLPDLVGKMNALAGSNELTAERLEREIRPYDDQIARGRRCHNDDQLRRIAHLRNWFGDRIRTCAFQRILDPSAGPLIAIREFVLTRKTLGGMQTDLRSRVLGQDGHPIPGLYAIGEAAGFGGGGSSGKRSLEGTCLTGCILTAQAAARAIATSTSAAYPAADDPARAVAHSPVGRTHP